MYKPSHLIGLELGISVASVAVRREATGAATGWRGDAVATAKRALRAGEILDGEGGYTVWGKLMTAADSKARQCAADRARASRGAEARHRRGRDAQLGRRGLRHEVRGGEVPAGDGEGVWGGE